MTSRAARRARVRLGGAALALAVAGAHMAAIDGIGAALERPAATEARAASVMTVNTVQPAALPPATLALAPAPAVEPAEPARPGRLPHDSERTPVTAKRPPQDSGLELQGAAPREPARAPEPQAGDGTAPIVEHEAALATAPLPAEDFGLAFVAAAPAAPASSPAVAPPVYPTRLPPAARLEYELRRGPVGGSATLRWLPVGDRYTLSLEGGTLGFTVLNQASEGGYDRAGIAPQRFVDRRRGRDARAANFQRDSGRITFSGPSVEYVLLPGSQDRLSWMLQAAAIVNASPARFVPGSELSMFVAGARGDADVWTFDVVAREAVELPAGKVTGALRLKREPRKPYDTEVEVWLDPARHHLPVRLRLAVPQTGESTDFALRAAEL